MWDFFYLFGVITILVLVALGVVWWFVYRNKDEGNKDRQGGYDRYGVDRSVIIRRNNDAYPRSGRSDKDLFNVVSEIGGLQRRLSSLERQVEALRDVIRDLKYAGMRAPSHLQSERMTRPDNDSEFGAGKNQQSRETYSGISFFEQAKGSYQQLSAEGLRNLPLEPLFVYLDVDSSAQGSAVGESQRLFKQSDNKQNAFVVFQQDSREGWLFPNPRISYTESMRYVFPELSYENFTDDKQKVDPAKVKLIAEGVWEMLLSK
jgi:hypothetical protein